MSLRIVHPDLVPDTLEHATATLHDAYEDYVAHVSPAQMAISLETASFTLWLCEHVNALDVCDFGSGFTSYVLQRYAFEADRPVRVTSVDDSLEWLGWTVQFLERHDSYSGRLLSWADYQANPGTHDLIVYDFGGGETRNANMGYAFDRLFNPGYMIIDDVQQPTHQDQATLECEKRKVELFDLGEWTKDQFNRFAALAVRGPWSR